MKIFLFIITFLYFSAPHPLRLSVTNIIYDKNEKTITIHIKIFKNDLLNAIIIKNPKVTCKEDDLYKEVKSVTNYLTETFQIEIDKKKISLKDLELSES